MRNHRRQVGYTRDFDRSLLALNDVADDIVRPNARVRIAIVAAHGLPFMDDVKNPHEALLYMLNFNNLASCWSRAFLNSFCTSSSLSKNVHRTPLRSSSKDDDEKVEDDDASMAGYLSKRKQDRGSARDLLRIITSSWKMSYFSLKGCFLRWGESSTRLTHCIFVGDYRVKSNISADEFDSKSLSPRSKSRNRHEDSLCFSLVPKNSSAQVLVFQARNESERKIWLRTFKKAVRNTQRIRETIFSTVLPQKLRSKWERRSIYVLSKKFSSSAQWLRVEIAVVDSVLLILYKSTKRTRFVAISQSLIERCSNTTLEEFASKTNHLHTHHDSFQNISKDEKTTILERVSRCRLSSSPRSRKVSRASRSLLIHPAKEEKNIHASESFIWIRHTGDCDVLLDVIADGSTTYEKSRSSKDHIIDMKENDDDNTSFTSNDILISTDNVDEASYWSELIRQDKKSADDDDDDENLRRRSCVLEYFQSKIDVWGLLSSSNNSIESLYCTIVYAMNLYLHFGRVAERSIPWPAIQPKITHHRAFYTSDLHKYLLHLDSSARSEDVNELLEMLKSKNLVECTPEDDNVWRFRLDLGIINLMKYRYDLDGIRSVERDVLPPVPTPADIGGDDSFVCCYMMTYEPEKKDVENRHVKTTSRNPQDNVVKRYIGRTNTEYRTANPVYGMNLKSPPGTITPLKFLRKSRNKSFRAGEDVRLTKWPTHGLGTLDLRTVVLSFLSPSCPQFHTPYFSFTQLLALYPNRYTF